MAAYLNRTVSMMSGDGPHNRPIIVGGSSDLRHPVIRNGADNSPLQIFVRAKKKINDIFVEIEDYVKDTVNYMHELEKQQQIIDGNSVKKSEEFVNKVHGIRDVLARDHMKVAFFGRTSNGKSTVINAMLRDKILPSGIGHTTNCFLQVEGSPNDEAYLVLEGSDEKCSVESVGQLAHALCKEKLSESQLVRVFWPRNRCFLLRDDVVFVDSPGVDVTPNLDEWIDKHCLDADVFVLVANAESTLMVTEKNFFHKVSTKLSKPNIFILNNRWDASANEPEFLDQVRKQHQERAIDFLVKELKVCSSKEAEERIFFISAKEALLARIAEAGNSSPSATLADGFQTRYFEFQDFERKFEECISKSAVKTKFEQHSQRGKYIAGELREALDTIYNDAQRLREAKLVERKELHDKINYTEQQLMIITQEMKQKIHNMVEDVEQRVSKALNEEIRRLSNLVDEFNLPFHPEPLVLNVYKKELHTHVETGLGSNLRARLSTALALNMEASQREMTDRMQVLIPPETNSTGIIMPRRQQPFEILYRLNCDNLCADFHEDLEFRFSWGITTLIQRYAGSKKANILALRNDKREHPQNSIIPTTPIDTVDGRILCGNATAEDWSILSRIALASVSSQGTMGGLLVAGFLMKTVGWRVIIVTGAVYSCLYLYERLTWTNKAKEKSFKKQYVSHATRKLKMIVDLTSANCSHQVQQELSGTFARLCHLVDEATSDMDNKLKELEGQVNGLDKAASRAKVLRNKANYLTHELELFEDAYLKVHH
ncbi:transmembrane GTPase Marf isoform X2 [Onthophagus taurus]|uniref:transmembrane GTPase Marf isoform X2 n=1 Tax=Onthophagus taurus TaxID=166361 RepID=UPI000C209AE9|nr:transmembrane GTPase Marf isoform X2 [Onthophagus taurus]